MSKLDPDQEKELEVLLTKHNVRLRLTAGYVDAIFTHAQYEDFKKELKELICEFMDDIIVETEKEQMQT